MPPIAELTATLAELLPQVAAHGVFNAMLSNGQALWAHCSTQLHHIVRQHPFARASLQDDDVTVDFAEHTSPRDRVAVVVTEPLTKDEAWAASRPATSLSSPGERWPLRDCSPRRRSAQHRSTGLNRRLRRRDPRRHDRTLRSGGAGPDTSPMIPWPMTA